MSSVPQHAAGAAGSVVYVNRKTAPADHFHMVR